jgi:hypothetical protein
MVSSLARLVDGGQDNLYSQTRPTTLKRTKDGFKVVYCHRLVQSLWITTETHIYSFRVVTMVPMIGFPGHPSDSAVIK